MRLSVNWLLGLAVCCVIGCGVPCMAGPLHAAEYREIQWADLIPGTWHPEKLFEGFDFGEIPDEDQRAGKAYRKLMEEWAKAPVNDKIHGQRIQLAGFVAPLEWDGTAMKEFLLVPYFGACIHVPPPPANQIIHITMEKAAAGVGIMDIVRVYGTLLIEKKNYGGTEIAEYIMRLDKIEPYQN